MTTTTTDPNAAFAAERASQIGRILEWNAAIPERAAAAEQAAAELRASTEARVANGELRDNGDGTFTAMTGWDAGETWRMQQPRGFEQEQPMLLPVSNLDESTGSAALYTRVPAWHGLGNVVPEGVSDLDEVLSIGQIDFTVSKHQMRVSLDPDDIAAELSRPSTVLVPGKYVTMRTDPDGKVTPFGPVGNVYTPIQNRDAGRFLQDLIATRKVVFESAGATYGGRHVFIGMRLPENVMLDLGDGVADEIVPYLYWMGSHDGTSQNNFTVSPWRVECGNTERFNLRDAKARWGTRHTTNAMSDERMKEARRNLGLTVTYYEHFKAEEELLARTELAIAEFHEIVDLCYPLEENATDRQKRTSDERKGVLDSMYREESEKLGRTAYAGERAFTAYWDHVAPRKVTGDKLAAARATAILEGSEDGSKSTVHKRLLTLTKR